MLLRFLTEMEVALMPYSPTSKILIVTLGSFNKVARGDSNYDAQDSLAAILPSDTADSLLKTRQRALKWLMTDEEARWQGVPASGLEWNKNLVRGKDLGGDDERARYLPALYRFDGRFYQTLGREGRTKLLQSPHHVLFLCGLYGLMTPTEPIQLYSCPVESGWKIFDIWDDTLTNVLIDYMHEHRITRVFDMTAMSVRRKLIRWANVRDEAQDKVLHCVGSMAAGDYLLVAFGHLTRDFLLQATEDELLSIQFGTKKSTVNQDIWFHERPGPHARGPRDTDPDVEADELDRKKRGIIHFLNTVERDIGRQYEKVGDRVERLRRENLIEEKDRAEMQAVLHLRNKVVYREYRPTKQELQRVKEAWDYLSRRVEDRGWDIQEFRGY